MKQPKYMEELLRMISRWLGVAFVCAGILSFIGVLKPKTNSAIQAPTLLGIVFLVIGLAFIIASIIFDAIIIKKNKLQSELLEGGTKITGIVEKVYLQKNTQYGKQSPYRILYVFTYKNKVYHHKSCFLWEKPNLMTGDSIMVYANDFGKSTILL